MSNTVTDALREAARNLRDVVSALEFSAPVTHVYNPLEYAWEGYDAYLSRFATSPKRVVFMGMNPGPYGMAQTGVPFGAVPAAREWMGINVAIGKPGREHPKRPVTGFECAKVEVSGRRLWLELFAVRFPRAEDFFRDHLVLNYCPLVFMVESGANYTPDKLRVLERNALETACDHHIQSALEVLRPEWLVGVGVYARGNLERVAAKLSFTPRIASIIHPAPASPLANREWPRHPRAHLMELGIWPPDHPAN